MRVRSVIAAATLGIASKAAQPLLPLDSPLSDVDVAGACGWIVAPTTPNPADMITNPYNGLDGGDVQLMYNDCNANVLTYYWQYPACVPGDDACDGGGQINNSNSQQKNCQVNTNGQHACYTGQLPDAGLLAVSQGTYTTSAHGRYSGKTGYY